MRFARPIIRIILKGSARGVSMVGLPFEKALRTTTSVKAVLAPYILYTITLSFRDGPVSSLASITRGNADLSKRLQVA